MIEEDATVIARDGDSAIIEVARQSSCGQCAAAKGCGTAVFANWYGKRMNQMRVSNPIHAAIGEKVVVGMQEDALLKASLMVYMMPLLMMGMFAIVGRWLANELFQAVVSDVIVMLLAVLGLVLALWLVRRFQRGVQHNPDYQPVILRRCLVTTSTKLIIPISKEF